MAEKTLDETTGDEAGSPADEVLKLKKRARRRLIGAIALALAAILILPAVMDREPAPSGSEIQVRIPSQETAATVPPAVDAAPAKPAVATAAAEASPAPASTPAPAPADAMTKSGPTVPDTAKPAAAEPDKPDAAKAEPAKPEATKTAPAKPAPAVPAIDDAARAELALSGRTPPPKKTPPPAEGGKWIVQLGAYQNPGNVAVLMGKLKEMRVPAYTEKFTAPQGPRTRVRAGPFASKDEAARAQQRIRVIGVNGTVAPATADK